MQPRVFGFEARASYRFGGGTQATDERSKLARFEIGNRRSIKRDKRGARRGQQLMTGERFRVVVNCDMILFRVEPVEGILAPSSCSQDRSVHQAQSGRHVKHISNPNSRLSTPGQAQRQMEIDEAKEAKGKHRESGGDRSCQLIALAAPLSSRASPDLQRPPVAALESRVCCGPQITPKLHHDRLTRTVAVRGQTAATRWLWLAQNARVFGNREVGEKPGKLAWTRKKREVFARGAHPKSEVRPRTQNSMVCCLVAKRTPLHQGLF